MFLDFLPNRGLDLWGVPAHPVVQLPNLLSECPQCVDRILRCTQLQCANGRQRRHFGLLVCAVVGHDTGKTAELDGRGVEEDMADNPFGESAVDLAGSLLLEGGISQHFLLLDRELLRQETLQGAVEVEEGIGGEVLVVQRKPGTNAAEKLIGPFHYRQTLQVRGQRMGRAIGFVRVVRKLRRVILVQLRK